MTPTSLEERRARAAADAAEWLERFNSESLSVADRGDFVDWLRESPLHVAEMLRISRLSTALAEFAGWEELASLEPHASADDRVVPIAAAQAAVPDSRPPVTRRRLGRAAIAAGIVLLVGSAALLLERQYSAATFATQAGERREVTLQDGSVMRLSAETEVHVDLQRALRSLVLTKGEAVFKVTKDPARPFVVSAGGSSVRAVGTIFAVARQADAVVVTVTEGRVAVVPASAGATSTRGSASAIALQANERLSISLNGAAGEISRIVSGKGPDWIDSQLTFENLRISQVVAEFNRRNRLQIRIADQALAERTVSGIFAADDPHSFVDFLTGVAGARSAQSNPDEIVVTSGPERAASAAPAH